MLWAGRYTAQPPGVYFVMIDSKGRLYTATQAGAFVSEDKGATWIPQVPLPHPHLSFSVYLSVCLLHRPPCKFQWPPHPRPRWGLSGCGEPHRTNAHTSTQPRVLPCSAVLLMTRYHVRIAMRSGKQMDRVPHDYQVRTVRRPCADRVLFVCCPCTGRVLTVC